MMHSATPATDSPPAPARPESAWITRFERPLMTRLDGACAGLSFAVKDNIDVAGAQTTAACPTFAYQADTSAFVVQRLLDAGARLAGKTNLDQFACGLNGTRSPYGAVPNAFDPTLVSGGSSSGSAYVVARGEVDFSIGTDTAGSGRVPAGLNNIVGFKPSKGLLSASGVVPAAQSVDCVSLFARTVGTVARVFDTARGFDAADPFARRLALPTPRWRGPFRFGVPTERVFLDPAAGEAEFTKAIKRLQALGGTPVPVDYTPLREAAALLYDSALVAERYQAIRPFFDRFEDDVIEPVRSIVAQGRGYTAADVFEAQLQLRELTRQAEAMWEHIDLLLVPTTTGHVGVADMLADPVALNRSLGAYTNFVNLMDLAAIAVPSSLDARGLPFGVTLIAPAGSDWSLLELGQRFHHATGLPLGATGEPLPALEPIGPPHTGPTVDVVVVGAHLSGMPLNTQLTERGATLLRATRTAAHYRLFALPDSSPPKPGLLRVAPGTGAAIEVEVWRLPTEHYGSFVALIPQPLGIGTLDLADGSRCQGFICEPCALEGAQDITHFGGWRAYRAAA